MTHQILQAKSSSSKDKKDPEQKEKKDKPSTKQGSKEKDSVKGKKEEPAARPVPRQPVRREPPPLPTKKVDSYLGDMDLPSSSDDSEDEAPKARVAEQEEKTAIRISQVMLSAPVSASLA